MRSMLKAMKQKLPGSTPKKGIVRLSCNEVCVKPEYKILDLAVELKDLTNNYDINPLNVEESEIDHRPVVYLAKASLKIDSNENDEIPLKIDIETQMYNVLSEIYNIITREQILEAYVLRELRHIQVKKITINSLLF